MALTGAVVVFAWIALAVVVVLLATQVGGRTSSSHIAALQSLTPYAGAVAIPIAAFAIVTHRWLLGGGAVLVIAMLIALSRSMLFPGKQPDAAEGGEPTRVFHSNLLFSNTRAADITTVLTELDADVLAFTEYTPTLAADLLASPLAESYPHRIDYAEYGAGGAAIWSKHNLREIDMPAWRFHSCGASVDSPDPLDVYVVHPRSPLVSVDEWQTELGQLAALETTPGQPAVMIGDFNASVWHGSFRALLRAGWRDAHIVRRRFSNSWPTDVRWFPAFVRIDHALVNEHLVVTGIDDIDVPGSDHRGLMVTVVRTTR